MSDKRVEKWMPGRGKTVSVPAYTGWYFASRGQNWDRYGPYDGTAVGQIMGAFRSETGKTPKLGDRIYIDSELYSLVKDAPPRVIAQGADAEALMQQMRGGGV